MRGQQTIYDNIFQSLDRSAQGVKGKRNLHLERRNETIASRYYFYGHIKRLRFDDCLHALEREFFLTPSVLSQIITEKAEYIRNMVSGNRTVANLKKEFPYVAW